MSSRLGWFVLGAVAALVGMGVGAYLFIRTGGMPMETSAKPLPLEQTVARMALRASIGKAAAEKDPLPVDAANMRAGAVLCKEHCGVCQGLGGRRQTFISEGIFPPPPQLFEKDDMVTRHPEGVTYWKVSHGIRLSGMPAFGSTLSTTQRWQITMLVSHADKLSPVVAAALAPVR